MIPEHMRFNKSIKLSELALELQNPQSGLKLVDRTWHFKSICCVLLEVSL